MLLRLLNFLKGKFLEGTRDVYLLEYLILHLLLGSHGLGCPAEHGCQVVVLIISGEGDICDEIEGLLHI